MGGRFSGRNGVQSGGGGLGSLHVSRFPFEGRGAASRGGASLAFAGGLRVGTTVCSSSGVRFCGGAGGGGATGTARRCSTVSTIVPRGVPGGVARTARTSRTSAGS